MTPRWSRASGSSARKILTPSMTEQALQVDSVGRARRRTSRRKRWRRSMPIRRRHSGQALLLLRGEAHEKAGQAPEAAADYQAIYLRFAASEQAREAGERLDCLARNAGGKFPPLPLISDRARGHSIWRERLGQRAQRILAVILPKLPGRTNARNCAFSNAAWRSERSLRMVALRLPIPTSTPSVRTRSRNITAASNREPEMIAAVETAAPRTPKPLGRVSAVSGRQLLLGGAGSRPRLDLLQAPVEGFPNRRMRPTHSGASRGQQCSSASRKPPSTCSSICGVSRLAYTADALYWLGRLAEECRRPSRCAKLITRSCWTASRKTISRAGATRVRALGPGPARLPTCSQRFLRCRPPQALGDGFRRRRQKRHKRALMRCDRSRSTLRRNWNCARPMRRPANRVCCWKRRRLRSAAGHVRRGHRHHSADYPQLEAQTFTRSAARGMDRGLRAAISGGNPPLVGPAGHRSHAGRRTDPSGIRVCSRGALAVRMPSA